MDKKLNDTKVSKQCPKCKRTHFKSLDGIPCCINCGTLHLAMIRPVEPMEFDHRIKTSPKHERGDLARGIVRENIQLIKFYREASDKAQNKSGKKLANRGWQEIAHHINALSGESFDPHTIKKYAGLEGVV